MLGRAVVEAAQRLGHEVRGATRAELDITDAGALRQAVAERRPDAIINCAAYTDVDGAESDRFAAFAINGKGAGNVAAAADGVGAAIVHVSTDYVFDGA
jgi:dTDP-4-dehydrorhamnose reductase